jgi:hypothetical protein
MSAAPDLRAMAAFLVEAKRNTYAAHGDGAAVPGPVPASRKLEFRDKNFTYRDIYIGSRRFAGQEFVHQNGTSVWTMVYAGGMSEGVSEGTMRDVYTFLRRALRAVTPGEPYRGPRSFLDRPFTYVNEPEGDLGAFRGIERILQDGRELYRLTYAGGLVII